MFRIFIDFAGFAADALEMDGGLVIGDFQFRQRLQIREPKF